MNPARPGPVSPPQRGAGSVMLLWWALAGLAALSLARLVLSTKLPLFGDEAFYWLEGRYPAWAYSDLPPMTAWLTRAGTALAGQGYGPVRGWFLISAALTSVLMVAVARRGGAATGDSLLAAVIGLALPVFGVLAPFALPDVMLNLLWLTVVWLALLVLDDQRRWWLWPLLGLTLAAGWLTHYRFAPLAAGLTGLFLCYPPARRLLATPGPWLAAVIGLSALWPQWQFNQSQEFAALSFQLLDRHPWRFDPSGWRLVALDLVLLTPLVLWLLWRSLGLLWRRRSQPFAAVLLSLGAFPVLVYWLLSPLVDTQRVSFHWTLGGWLTLCAALPWALDHCRRHWRPAGFRWLLVGAVLPGLLFSSAALVYWYQVSLRPAYRPASNDVVPDNLLGWPQVADRMRQLQDQTGAGRLLADNFMLAAQLSFETGQEVHSLDHPLNHKHGRAVQMALWDRLLTEPPAAPSLLAVEVNALGLQQRPGWLDHICRWIGPGRILDELVLFGGRKRFLVYLLSPQAAGCDQPAFWYLDEPTSDAQVSSPFSVKGWAFETATGVAGVDVLLNGEILTTARYGLPKPGVGDFFNVAHGPDHPNVGFEVVLDLSAYAPGPHRLGLQIRERDGGIRRSDPITIELASGGPER